jgi:hypothetical protein
MERARTAIFFLSTGRCGTQWLQEALSARYPDVAVATHEPVTDAYEPKRYLRAYDKLDELLSTPAVANHLAEIRQTLKSKTYIETGWPCYPALPLIIDQLDGRVRIVHLVRHPVFVALSLATHRIYERDDWISHAAISPSDPGTVQRELADGWAGMSMYEKCLFWWTEINLYALELRQRRPDIEFTLVRYEDLFGPSEQTLERLIGFMGLGYDPALRELRSRGVDRYHLKAPPMDWKLVFKYSRTVALAKEFGYEFSDGSTPYISKRYFGER